LGGTYEPNIKKSYTFTSSLWDATGKFTISSGALIKPNVFGGGNWAANAEWYILEGGASLTGAESGHMHADSQGLVIEAHNPVDKNRRWLKRG